MCARMMLAWKAEEEMGRVRMGTMGDFCLVAYAENTHPGV